MYFILIHAWEQDEVVQTESFTEANREACFYSQITGLEFLTGLFLTSLSPKLFIVVDHSLGHSSTFFSYFRIGPQPSSCVGPPLAPPLGLVIPQSHYCLSPSPQSLTSLSPNDPQLPSTASGPGSTQFLSF